MPLFSNFQLGGLTLPNRIVMAPMTRSRAKTECADELTAAYYAQRSTAGLIVSEGVPISREAVGYAFLPGISTDEQVAGFVVIGIGSTEHRQQQRTQKQGRFEHGSSPERF